VRVTVADLPPLPHEAHNLDVVTIGTEGAGIVAFGA